MANRADAPESVLSPPVARGCGPFSEDCSPPKMAFRWMGSCGKPPQLIDDGAPSANRSPVPTGVQCQQERLHSRDADRLATVEL